MGKMKKIVLLAALLGLFVAPLKAQTFGVLTGGNYSDPLWLAQNILVNSNFTVTTPVNFSTGGFISQPPTAQIGVFYGGNSTSLGIDSGIVMSTGAAVAPVPGSTFTNPNVATPSANLTSVISQIMYQYNAAFHDINDKVMMAFSFIAPSDTVQFEYVFASAEYANYTCSQYNDVFGFFLIGTNINGNPLVDTVNLASIPNSNPPIPVSVNSVNSGAGGTPAYCTHVNPGYTASSVYFVGNPTGLNTTEITGHTVKFTAQAHVQCGNVYTIKMLIADVSDGALNSHVFLKANSFKVPTIDLSSNTNTGSSLQDSMIVEGCPGQELIVNKNGNINSDMTIHFIKGGNAVDGVDYLNFPDSLYIPAGKAADTITFYAPNDGVAEGIDTLNVVLMSTSTLCWSYPSQEFTYLIRDADPVVPVAATVNGSDTIYCPGDSVEITGSFTGGEGNGQGFWLDNPSLSGTRMVGPSATTTFYYGSVAECMTDTIIDSVTIYLDNYTPMSSTGDSALICLGEDATITATPINGSPPYQVDWATGVNGTTQTVSPNDTTWYYYTAIDQCAQVFSDSVRVAVAPEPVARFGYNQNPTNPLQVFFSNTSQNAATYLWDFGGGQTSTDTTPTFDYERPGTYSVTLSVVSDLGCTDDFTYDVVVETDYYLYIPTAFTPDGDGINETFIAKGVGFDTYDMWITNRWGNQIYHTSNIEEGWDGTINGVRAKPDVYAYRVVITIPVTGEVIEKQGTFILSR
ncbi:MAG: hypothetical protein SchgKO_13510 [Schleiferiaceae bacterium]